MDDAGVGFRRSRWCCCDIGSRIDRRVDRGLQFGKGIAIANRVPFVAVNHLEAHALTARLPGLVERRGTISVSAVPALRRTFAMYRRVGVGHHVRLGGTVDDAAGEAFDKVAKLLDLGWPGGTGFGKAALQGVIRQVIRSRVR